MERSRRAQNSGVTQAGMEDKRGPPIPGPPNAFPPVPTPIHGVQTYLLAELLSQAQPGGGTAAAAAPRSGGGDSLSPRLAPGRRQREGGARGSREPVLGYRGTPGWLGSGTRLPRRQGQASLGRRKKRNEERLESKKRQGKHYQAAKRIASKCRRKSRARPVPL